MIQRNTNIFDLIRWTSSFKLNNLPKKSSKTLIVCRCIISNRKKRLFKFLNVSRLLFLNFARFGEICGIRKAVW